MRRESQLRSQLALILLLIVSIAQCSGEKGLSTDVDFASRTGEPIVIKGDRTIGSGETRRTVKAPWFLWEYSFLNKTDKRVVVATAIFTVSTRKNGMRIKKEFVLDIGQSCTGSITRSNLAVLEPYDPLGSAHLFSGLTGCDMDDLTQRLTPTQGYEAWYIHDLGESDSGVFNIEIEVIGWFEDPAKNYEIIERYQDYDYIVTR